MHFDVMLPYIAKPTKKQKHAGFSNRRCRHLLDGSEKFSLLDNENAPSVSCVARDRTLALQCLVPTRYLAPFGLDSFAIWGIFRYVQ
jgi:hypothetical protein